MSVIGFTAISSCPGKRRLETYPVVVRGADTNEFTLVDAVDVQLLEDGVGGNRAREGNDGENASREVHFESGVWQGPGGVSGFFYACGRRLSLR